MENKTPAILLFCILLICTACNIPVSNPGLPPAQNETEYIWDLSRLQSSSGTAGGSRPYSSVYRTPTPQLYKAIDFEQMFADSQEGRSASAVIMTTGEDQAEWLFFDPADYSGAPLDTLYTAFTNTGQSTLTNDYDLEFFAGRNPSPDDKVLLDAFAAPGEKAMFRIPISTDQSSWKSCWYLKNDRGETFYEFCYNHGSGINANDPQYAQNSSSGSSSASDRHPFTKVNGSAPARFSNSEFSADFVSTKPKNGHTFRAYDHNENLSVSFKNNGSEVWDSSYSLVFYSGYNWMHRDSFPLEGTTWPGETASVSLPMEIYEDNDTWVTCWYLSTPDGKNLSDFCFNYYTRS